MTQSQEESKRNHKLAMALIASHILANEGDLLDNLRQMVRVGAHLEGSDSDLILPIVAFESDTDRFPTGASRDLWDPAALQRVDREKEEYLEIIEPELFDACRRIVEEFRED